MKISRKALSEAANTLPLTHILGADVSRQLTAKQKKFAREVAKGATKADAYRSAYDVTSQRTLNVEPYMLVRDPRIAKEIEAYELALEAEKHRSPAALRSLVIQQLTEHALDKDIPPAQRIKALQLLGTVAEVGAFVELKQVRTISSSEDARARVMQELRALVSNGAEDATVIEADSLLAELTGDATVKFNAAPDASPEQNAEPDAQTPPAPDPPNA